ncbi:hypothetical protein BX265_2334 [Streptomyces sp. TLI_235]|nr:hypothetical protein [Streptomyces sp. TLI_235]PBC77583.1 hypothetical protein BX265_2334 [Streptomyces sp. TLI_235]
MKTDEQYLRELIISGAPSDANPAVVEKYAAEVAEEVLRAEEEGKPVGPAIYKVAEHYPELRRPEETPRDLRERLEDRPQERAR